jgi:hypothetical protein
MMLYAWNSRRVNHRDGKLAYIKPYPEGDEMLWRM